MPRTPGHACNDEHMPCTSPGAFPSRTRRTCAQAFRGRDGGDLRGGRAHPSSDSTSGPSERPRVRLLVRRLFGIVLRQRAVPTLEFIRPGRSWEDREFSV